MKKTKSKHNITQIMYDSLIEIYLKFTNNSLHRKFHEKIKSIKLESLRYYSN